MIKRATTKYDIDILKELQKIFSKDNVKIDFDIMSEPCIFFLYKGPFDIVYKLSQTGYYSRNLAHYTIQAKYAILEYIKQKDKEIYNTKKELEYIQNMDNTRRRIANNNLNEWPE